MQFYEWLSNRKLQEGSFLARKVWVRGREYTVEDMPNGGLHVTSSNGRQGSIIGNAVGAGSSMDYPELRGVLDASIDQERQKEREQEMERKKARFRRW